MEKLLKRSRVATKKSDKAGPGFSKEKSPESSGGFPGTLQAMTILRSESSGFSIKEVAPVERRRHAFRPADVALEATVERPAAVFGELKPSWTRIGSDTADLNNRDADKYDIDSVNVQTLRAGLNLSAQMSESVKARVGAAYEHVFDGDADGRISGLVIDNSASLEGNRGVFELGLTIAPTESSLSLDLGLSG